MARSHTAVQSEPATRVSVAAFGKHPGWDDHIEDLGLGTERLIRIRQAMYVQGIGGNIDSGAWDKLKPEQRLDGFCHVFVSHSPGDVVVGRMWSSTDRKGRSRYPMVVCVHFSGPTLEWALGAALQRLEQVEQRCRSASTAADVRAIMAGLRREFHDGTAGASCDETQQPPWIPPGEVLSHLAAGAELGGGRPGLARLLYKIAREMVAYGPGRSEGAAGAERRPSHLRVPMCADGFERAASLWVSFMRLQLDRSTPLLLLHRLDSSWTDIIVGEPTAQQFHCLQASLEAVPLITEIPYTWDEGFEGRLEALLAASREGTGGPSILREPRDTGGSLGVLAKLAQKLRGG